MKKKSIEKKKKKDDTLRAEYLFDYSKSQPNRFAAALPTKTRVRKTKKVT